MTFDNLLQHQQTDDRIARHLADGKYQLQEYSPGKELVFYDDKVVLPMNIVSDVIEWYHGNLNHPGIDRTYHTIAAHFYFSGLRAKVEEHISNCPVCRKNKRSEKKYGELPLAEQEMIPWECVQIDLCGPWKFKCVNGIEHSIRAVTMIDPVLRWVEIHSYDDKKSETISLIFDHEWLCRYPRHRRVIYDNGSEFTSEFEELLLSYGIIAARTTVKNPQANAIVEHLHLTMGDSIRDYGTQHTSL